MRILGSPPRLSEGRAGAIAPETWLAPALGRGESWREAPETWLAPALGRGESWREAPERGYYRSVGQAPPLRHIVTPFPDAGRGKRTWGGARIFDNAKSCVQPPVSGRLNFSDIKKSRSRRSRTDRSTRSGAAFSSAGGRLKAHRPRRRSRARANPAV